MKPTIFTALLSLTFCWGSAATAETLDWTRQLGSNDFAQSWSVSADGLGNAYISGHTTDSLDGDNAGGSDAFVSKYDFNGTLEWTRQLGTDKDDRSYGVSANEMGEVYISGFSLGVLEGTDGSPGDAFVSKYNDSGVLQWTQQFGSTLSDESTSVSADRNGNAYVSGWTSGDLGGPNAGSMDAFVSKFDDNGVLQWSRQLGTSSRDTSRGVSIDEFGDIYIAGETSGSLGGTFAGGNGDAFLSKYDHNGVFQWSRQLGTSDWDRANDVSADGMGSVYISGYTNGSLDRGGRQWLLGGVSQQVRHRRYVPMDSTTWRGRYG